MPPALVLSPKNNCPPPFCPRSCPSPPSLVSSLQLSSLLSRPPSPVSSLLSSLLPRGSLRSAWAYYYQAAFEILLSEYYYSSLQPGGTSRHSNTSTLRDTTTGPPVLLYSSPISTLSPACRPVNGRWTKQRF